RRRGHHLALVLPAAGSTFSVPGAGGNCHPRGRAVAAMVARRGSARPPAHHGGGLAAVSRLEPDDPSQLSVRGGAAGVRGTGGRRDGAAARGASRAQPRHRFAVWSENLLSSAAGWTLPSHTTSSCATDAGWPTPSWATLAAAP